MQDLNQLKKIVIESFEAKGILSEIRAQIRASVFKVVEESETEAKKANFSWEKENPLSITQKEERIILAILISDFLSHMDLQYSCNVFKHETNLHLVDASEERLQRVGINTELKHEPYLYQILKKLKANKEEKQIQDSLINNNSNNQINNPHERPTQDKSEDQHQSDKQLIFERPIDNEEAGIASNDQQDIEQQVSNAGLNNNYQEREFLNNLPQNYPHEVRREERGEHPMQEEGMFQNQEEEDDPNQVYLSEPVALDVTADSDILKEFDYDESVENFRN